MTNNTMTFRQKLEAITKKNNSLLCVGLDPEIEKLPKHLIDADDPIFEFNKAIIDATHNFVCVYKPNSAFYEAYGLAGHHALKQTIEYIHQMYPEIPVILDAKRGDIGNSSKMYAKAVFEYWNSDAVTLHPFTGKEGLQPFFQYKDKFSFVFVRSSNQGSKDFQDMKIKDTFFYEAVAKKISMWPEKNIGVVVGGTFPNETKKIREILPDKIFLIPGIGAQSGDLKKTVKYGITKKKDGIIISASRSILYASKSEDFAEKAGEEAQRLRDEINEYRL